MSRIADIHSEWQRITDTNTSVGKFIFDDVGAINDYLRQDFPLVLLKLPQQSTISEWTKYWELWDMVVMVMKPIYQSDDKSIAENWDSLRKVFESLLDSFIVDKQEYQLIGEVNFEYGHDEYLQDMCIVKASFKIRLHNCRTNTATAKVVTVTDNSDSIVGTVAAPSTLKVIAKDQNGTTLSASYVLSNGLLSLTVTTGSQWLLSGGVWADGGVWDDTAVWID